jgi:hypothetical protein
MNTLLQKKCAKSRVYKSIWLVLLFLQMGSAMVYGQARVVKGRVIAQDDQTAIPGASILVKGTKVGANSNADGNFSVNVPANGILQISMIGFATKEVNVGSQSEVTIVLATDAKQLQEVVVTALGIKKDIRKIGVAIQSVDGASTIKAREPNAINALSGRVAGLTIGSQPELLRKPNISLRGSSTILYVVDGVPIN